MKHYLITERLASGLTRLEHYALEFSGQDISRPYRRYVSEAEEFIRIVHQIREVAGVEMTQRDINLLREEDGFSWLMENGLTYEDYRGFPRITDKGRDVLKAWGEVE